MDLGTPYLHARAWLVCFVHPSTFGHDEASMDHHSPDHPLPSLLSAAVIYLRTLCGCTSSFVVLHSWYLPPRELLCDIVSKTPEGGTSYYRGCYRALNTPSSAGKVVAARNRRADDSPCSWGSIASVRLCKQGCHPPAPKC